MMSETTKLICITCPKGCTLMVTHEGETVLEVEGNTCKRGAEYARAELSDPRRMVATTVRIKDGIHPLLPVYTAKPFPKPRIHELLKELRDVELSAPVQMGAVVVKDVLDTGIDIVASRDMGRTE
jgi:CxxC motif-containing protein